MDQKSWVWKKKPTEKTLVADKANNSMTYADDAAEQPLALKGEQEGDLMTLNDKKSAALSEYNSKDNLGRPLKKDVDKVLLQKAASEEKSNQLDLALKDCMQQLHYVREDQEKRIHTAVVKALEEFDRTRMALEQRLAEAGKRIVILDSDNAQLKKAQSGKDKMIQELNEYRAQMEADIDSLTLRMDATEKENASLKYEVRVLEKELDIRNEEAEFSRRAADVSEKKYKESIQKITSLESECQKLRLLVRKRLPGPVALTRMKNEAEMLSRDPVRKRNSSLCGSIDTPNKQISFLTEQLNAMEEENRSLRHALTKRPSELQVPRNMYIRAASRLSRGEVQVDESPKSLSDLGSDESLASALLSELDNFKNEKQLGTPSHGNMGASEMYLMDDFVQMEKLVVVSDNYPAGGSCPSSEEGNAHIGPSESVNAPDSLVRSGNVFQTSEKSSNSDGHDTKNNEINVSSTAQNGIQLQPSVSMSIQKVLKLLEGISNDIADQSFSEKDPTGYFVRVLQWKATDLSNILQQSVQTCNDLLNGEADLARFAEAVASHLDWVVNHCFSIQDNVSSMEGAIRDGLDSDESVKQCESEGDQIDNQTRKEDDKLCNNEDMQQSMTSKAAEDDGNPSNDQFQNDREITAASKKLAECQETILNLEKKFQSLASPNDLALFNEVMSTADPVVITSTPASQRNGSHRLSLLDNMLAEDHAADAVQTSAVSARKFSDDDGDAGTNGAPNSMAIVSVRKNGGKSFLKRLFRWHKRGKSKKTLFT